MTLSPVFRSQAAVELLQQSGIWEILRPAMADQARAVDVLYDDLPEVLDSRFIELPAQRAAQRAESIEFLQEFFFLILFRSLFESLGFAPARLPFYSELNFCIKGTITAADNLFDDQEKSLLPLRRHTGARFMSILQLMSFERLIRRTCDRAEKAGSITPEQTQAVLRGLLSMMASIGELEGSEEKGVAESLGPQEMIEKVHRVRGGALFALSFVAPRILETGEAAAKVAIAEEAIARLGTAFQIVDDLTDFEFDLTRHSHNLLVAQIRATGTQEEKALLERLWQGEPPTANMVETTFAASARAVLQYAYDESRMAFDQLASIGFWFPPELSNEVVHAIVGLEGVSRMDAIR